jgi:hypothetical protein
MVSGGQLLMNGWMERRPASMDEIEIAKTKRK